MKQSILLALAISATFLGALAMTGENVSAAELNYYGIETSVSKTLQVDTTATLIFDKPINHLDYTLDFEIVNMTARTNSGTSMCGYENNGRGCIVSCDFSGMREDEATIELTFSTRDVITRVGDNYEIKASYPINMPAKRIFSIIKLPPNGVLAAEVTNESFFPPDGNVLTDGKQIIVSWERRNVTANDTLTFSVLFEVLGSGGIMWDVSVAALTLIVVVAMVGVAVYIRRGAPQAEKDDKVVPLLNKDEKRIVDIIAKQGGESKQRVIVRESDFSKAKVSRLLKNLKERGVIDLEPISGRENKAILKIRGV